MKTKDPKKVASGKKSRAAGQRFEVRVRKDLEEKGWIVAKWMNNVEFFGMTCEKEKEPKFIGKLVHAKSKFRGPGIPMMLGAGFPDFIAFQTEERIFRGNNIEKHYIDSTIIGVESKMDGYLDKKEKEKCKWLLENNIFSKILIAMKGKKRGEIKYKEFCK